jgi:hypothetical protein
MGFFRKIKDTEEDRARARLLTYFEDNPDQVFYSRQLEVLFEREYFHWVTNRALRRLVDEGRARRADECHNDSHHEEAPPSKTHFDGVVDHCKMSLWQEQ